jgi:hypothetical protein
VNFLSDTLAVEMLLFSSRSSCLSHPSHSRRTAGVYSKVVDVYNITTGTWSTAEVSVARRNLAATTSGCLALFAGGFGAQGTGTGLLQ